MRVVRTLDFGLQSLDRLWAQKDSIGNKNHGDRLSGSLRISMYMYKQYDSDLN